MFLVSNEEMVISAVKAGATAAIPALNYRTIHELREGIRRVRLAIDGPFGINLIVNRSNPLLDKQLAVCCEQKVDFIITSLGSPKKVIQEAHKCGILVFCDVTDVEFARKAEGAGADAIIAVNSEAGGHAGSFSYVELLPKLLHSCNIPIISAGGVGTGEQMKKVMKMGAAGISAGSVFIATIESGVSKEYKQACVDYSANDIVLTSKLSGTPCTVINTPYVQKIGTKENVLEHFLNRNKRFKKWIKMIVFTRGMKRLRKAAFSSTYQSVWCAGPSIEHVRAIRSVGEIIKEWREEFDHDEST
jgi:nitronate monooxygenase